MEALSARASLARWLDYPVGEGRAATRRFWRETALAYLYLLPNLVIIGAFGLYPVVRALDLSLYDWDMVSPVKAFVGLANYRELLGDPEFWRAVRNTALYVACTVPASIALALGSALVLHQPLAGRAFYRLAFFIPYVSTVVAVAMVWGWIFHDRWGLLNHLLGLVGLPPQRWLLDPRWSLLAVIVFSVWKSLGYNVVLFLAGLTQIDRELYAAARVDGAGGWRLFRHITWPLLFPTTFFVSVIATIAAFKVFTEVYVLFGGRAGPMESALTIVFYIYQKGFSQWNMGLASAGSCVLFFIILACTLVQMWYGRRHDLQG